MMDNYLKINEEVYKCMENVFEIVNEKEDNIEFSSSSKNLFKVINFDHLIGIDCFWNTLNHCREQNVLFNLYFKKKLFFFN